MVTGAANAEGAMLLARWLPGSAAALEAPVDMITRPPGRLGWSPPVRLADCRTELDSESVPGGALFCANASALTDMQAKPRMSVARIRPASGGQALEFSCERWATMFTTQ